MNKTGYFYTKFQELNPGYSRDTFKAAEDVVGKMLNPPAARESTNPLEHPGVLLAKREPLSHCLPSPSIMVSIWPLS